MTTGTPPASPKLLRFLTGVIPELSESPEVNVADVEWLRQFTQRLLFEADAADPESPPPSRRRAA